jgi:hypothetical protein
MVNALAKLQPADITRIAAVWAATDEWRGDGVDSANSNHVQALERLVGEYFALAHRAQREGKHMYMWMSLWQWHTASRSFPLASCKSKRSPPRMRTSAWTIRKTNTCGRILVTHRSQDVAQPGICLAGWFASHPRSIPLAPPPRSVTFWRVCADATDGDEGVCGARRHLNQFSSHKRSARRDSFPSRSLYMYERRHLPVFRGSAAHDSQVGERG